MNVRGIMNSQQAQLQFGSRQNRDLQQDYEQLGADKFIFEVLDQLELSDRTPQEMREDLAALEELWLEKLQPYGERGYHKPPLNKLSKNKSVRARTLEFLHLNLLGKMPSHILGRQPQRGCITKPRVGRAFCGLPWERMQV